MLGWSATLSSSTITPPTLLPIPGGCTAGQGVTGRSCGGFCPRFRTITAAELLTLLNRDSWAPLVAFRLSSTNLGLLFNAHLAAHELGYLTLEEYAEGVERTLKSALQLPRHNGHFFNWYEIQTSHPLEPQFISTVDSGNLAACLWTLKQSCLGLASEPLLSKNLWRGIRDHIRFLSDLSPEPSLPLETCRAIQ